MKAFVMDDKNKAIKVTNEYKTLRGLENHALDGLPPGKYTLEVHYNWDTRYREPDFKTTVRKEKNG